MDSKKIAQLRKDYASAPLEREALHADPIEQFRHWFQEALQADLPEPNAMVLATVGLAGKPAARVVLLKGLTDQGFIFYTNYLSRKGLELAHTHAAALVFNWLELHRQVRVEGEVVKLSPEASTEYFQSRPKGSQIGAWASPQSRPVQDRAELESRVQAFEEEYAGHTVLPRPQHWGGYLVIPEMIEFWQGRPSRMHDRFQYLRTEDGGWKVDRLAP